MGEGGGGGGADWENWIRNGSEVLHSEVVDYNTAAAETRD